jgi:hypothetical protein
VTAKNQTQQGTVAPGLPIVECIKYADDKKERRQIVTNLHFE